MKTETIRNRYNSEYTFTELKDGNIQWNGNFDFSRHGFPNDYSVAYDEFKKSDDGDSLTLEQFKVEVHEGIYDENNKYLRRGPIAEKYSKMVTSNMDIRNMVDPSGGPYMSAGMECLGKVIVEFKANVDGYLIITK